MKDIKIIIPIDKINESVGKMLQKAIDSVDDALEIRLSCANGISEEIRSLINTKKKVIIYEDKAENSKKDFATLVNQAVDGAEWFSILEYDDTYSDNWLKNMDIYMTQKPEASVYMAFEDLVDAKEEKFIDNGNVAPWAASFSNELGYIDEESLENYFDYYMTGSVFNGYDWNSCGGLKSSIKLSFWYEFLLRMTKNDKKIYVIPKNIYKHTMGREGSLMSEMSLMTDDEKKFWFKTAKEESENKAEKKIEYVETKK